MAYNKDRGDSPMRRRGPRRRKKVCAFCSDKEHDYIDYKDVAKLKRYMSKEVKFFLEELPVHVQSIREL